MSQRHLITGSSIPLRSRMLPDDKAECEEMLVLKLRRCLLKLRALAGFILASHARNEALRCGKSLKLGHRPKSKRHYRRSSA